MEGASGGVGPVARLTDDQVAAFVTASCAAQGVPVKVTDSKVLGDVVVLLGGGGRSDGPASEAGPGRRAGRSEPPGDLDPVGVEDSGASAGQDGGPVDDGGDDGVLPGEVEFGP